MSRESVPTLVHLSLGLLMAAGMIGCVESASTRQARLTREGAFARDIESVQSLEKHRTENLEATANVIREQAKHDARETERDLRTARDLADEDIKWWNRKQAGYRDALKRECKGKPESIETVLPRLVY